MQLKWGIKIGCWRGMLIIRSIFICVMCLILSSCTKQRSSPQQEINISSDDNNQVLQLQKIIQQEASLVDIPIPLYNDRIINPLIDTLSTDTLAFGYKSPLSKNQAILFFMNEMERYGWQHLVSFDSDESILQFQSPYRFCTVKIKESFDEISPTHIFIYIKKDEQKELLA